MSVMRITILMLALAACAPPWPDDTQLVAEVSRVDQDVTSWGKAIDQAIVLWQDAIGHDCTFPFYRVEPSDAGPDARSIKLIHPDDWPDDDDHRGSIGLRWWDGGIEVEGFLPFDRVPMNTLRHELGHALAGDDHSSNPIDIMAPRKGTEFTPETINRVREARGCEPL